MKKILLATPTMHTEEQQYIQKAFPAAVKLSLWQKHCKFEQRRFDCYDRSPVWRE